MFLFFYFLFMPASLYAGSHEELVKDKKGWRLDVIAITKFGDKFEIKHYENI